MNHNNNNGLYEPSVHASPLLLKEQETHKSFTEPLDFLFCDHESS